MRKSIEQRMKEHKMAKQHFEEENNNISYPIFLFVILLAFILGTELGAWHAIKHKKPCNCTIHNII